MPVGNPDKPLPERFLPLLPLYAAFQQALYKAGVDPGPPFATLPEGVQDAWLAVREAAVSQVALQAVALAATKMADPDDESLTSFYKAMETYKAQLPINPKDTPYDDFDFDIGGEGGGE